jgi:hypothetical protein
MNSVQTVMGGASPRGGASSTAVVAGWVSVAQGLLIFVPMIVLGAAINWPESLSDPADIALPRLLENEGAVRLGYVAYLVYSILFAVTMALLVRFVWGATLGVVATIIIGFAMLSALARSIGIVRWLVPASDLADAYAVAPGESERVAIAVVFDSLNSYGGTIGEVLGVSIFAAVAIGLLSISALRTRALPAWLSVFGLVAALAVLATAVELFGADASSLIFFGTTLVQVWFLAVGIWLLVGGRTRTPQNGIDHTQEGTP